MTAPVVPSRLLEDHVLPALVERGLVTPAARIAWADEDVGQPNLRPGPWRDAGTGRPQVRATGRRDPSGRVVARAAPTSAGPRVDVTIDKVEIVTPPAATPPAATPTPSRTSVDHADYRARRRRDGR